MRSRRPGEGTRGLMTQYDARHPAYSFQSTLFLNTYFGSLASEAGTGQGHFWITSFGAKSLS